MSISIPQVPLEQRVYIVGCPDGGIAKEALRIQTFLNDAFHIYTDSLPSLHITLAVAAAPTPQIEKRVCEAAGAVLSTIPPVNLKVRGYTCLPDPYSSFAMEIEDSPDLRGLAANLHAALDKHGILVLSDPEQWDFHITLISQLFSSNPLPEGKYCRLCRLVRRPLDNLTGELRQVEIWRPDINDRQIDSFVLGSKPGPCSGTLG